MTSQGSSFFRLGLRYENAQKGRGLYGGDISEWSCRYGSKAEQLYTFTYDGAGRFTGGNHYENGVLVNKYVEQGINYDKNGNICNTVIISGGLASMKYANCKDKICVNHNKISKNNESIICLPNKVIVTVVSDKGSDVDEVAR